jgi:uncharacterized membrane protein
MRKGLQAVLSKPAPQPDEEMRHLTDATVAQVELVRLLKAPSFDAAEFVVALDNLVNARVRAALAAARKGMN